LGARKGGPNRPPEWAWPAGLGRPAQAHLGPVQSPLRSRGSLRDYALCPSTCMILTMSSSRPRWRFSAHEVQSFTLQSPGVFLVAFRSLPPLEVFHLAHEHEQDSINDPLNLLRIRSLCPCFPT
jgi:hypothetical protein